MYTREVLPVSLVNSVIGSSVTSTAVPTAVDMSPYFPVGRREVLFVVNIAYATTTVSQIGTVTIEECASTATASFTTVKSGDGSSATLSNSAGVNFTTYFYGSLNYRYVRAKFVQTTATTGDFAGVIVTAFPLVRSR